MYEVELKFRMADPAAVECRLEELAARFGPPVTQVDRYFSHPCRDFSRTDEALRLRRTGDEVRVTWKGPRLDAGTKTRREIELPLAVGPGMAATLDHWTTLLEALGFRVVREVAKVRRSARLEWQGAVVEAAIDTVVGLGGYLELEIQAGEADLPLARSQLAALALQLDAGVAEPRSYLEMLIERDRDG